MDLMAANALLGVDSTTPIEDVRARYRVRARMLHPDTLANRPDLLDEAGRAMADLNEAWRVISDADRAGTRHDPDPGGEKSDQAPIEGECDLCGAYPARRLMLRGTRGLLLARQEIRMRPDLCRDCGLSMFREVQADTMTRGWWGLTSALLTVPYLVGNLLAIRHHKRLPDPVGRRQDVVTPLHPGMPPAKPVIRRAVPLTATAVALFLPASFVVSTTARSSDDPSQTLPTETPSQSASVTPSPTEVAEDTPTMPSPVGWCVTDFGDLTSCSDPNATHEILYQVGAGWRCGDLRVLTSAQTGETFCARPLY